MQYTLISVHILHTMQYACTMYNVYLSFLPLHHLQTNDLKKRIESLIERDYMERSNTDKNIYHYVA